MVSRLQPSHKYVSPPRDVHFVSNDAISRREYRQSVTFLRRPHVVIYHAFILLWKFLVHLFTARLHLIAAIAAIVAGRVYLIDDSFDQYLEYEKVGEKVLIWVALGFLSSFGMGFGLHTFVIFLAPAIYHTAAIHSRNFSLSSSLHSSSSSSDSVVLEAEEAVISFFSAQNLSFLFGIWREVWWWAFAWGAGTAIGELPPYFAARAARIAGKKIEAIEELEGIKNDTPPGFVGKLQAAVVSRLEHFNFFHILLFASIPNPLFDLAGVGCGHAQKPFWMFFGATFVGKACIKATIQAWFVISAHHSVDKIAAFLNHWATRVNVDFDFVSVLKTYKRSLNVNGPSVSLSSFTEVFNSAEPPSIKDIIILIIIVGFFLSMIQTAVQAHLAEQEERALALAPFLSPKKKNENGNENGNEERNEEEEKEKKILLFSNGEGLKEKDE